MPFGTLIGQYTVREYILTLYRENRLPHALLLPGAAGVGALPMALATAQYRVCESPTETDACGICLGCRKSFKFIHPDIHFAFPVIPKEKEKKVPPISTIYLSEWIELLTESQGYHSLSDWYRRLGTEGNSPGYIYTKESEEIIHKMSYMPSEAPGQTLIIWLPEMMREEGANKLLKLIEEPPPHSLFLLVSESPEGLLPTIRSRVQQVHLPPLDDESLWKYMDSQALCSEEDRGRFVQLAEGNLLRLREVLTSSSEEREQFLFQFLRIAYSDNILELKKQVELFAKWGKARQKDFLQYAIEQIRNGYVLGIAHSAVRQNKTEEEFFRKFHPFIHENNIFPLVSEFSAALKHVAANVNIKVIFINLALRTGALLRMK